MVAHDCGQPFLYFCQGCQESQSGNRVVSKETYRLTPSGEKSGGFR